MLESCVSGNDDGVYPLNYHLLVVAKHRLSNEVVSEINC